MSLVAYGSSDESSGEENNSDTENVDKESEATVGKQLNEKLRLPPAKYSESEKEEVSEDDGRIHFDTLPKPKSSIVAPEEIEDDDILPKKDTESEKLAKKIRAPVKITVPLLSDFKDIEEEQEARANKIKPSSKGTKLFALLPKPKGEDKPTNSLIPRVINKTNTNQIKDKALAMKAAVANKVTKDATKSSIGISYDSNSEDEDESSANSTDFFALTSTTKIPITDSLMDQLALKEELNKPDNLSKDDIVEESSKDIPQKTLVSNIMNLPKEEILLKNKAEVGPKLPVPEQEYNIDMEGNVAFDEKAIEYLCGKRNIKRKREIDEANIIEINGEDIKPDEREWLVKALTEEPVQRPVSMMGGVNSQSKKKHQITYLAHQAKAMEMELKNQWAQNKMTRKQTQSKYGF